MKSMVFFQVKIRKMAIFLKNGICFIFCAKILGSLTILFLSGQTLLNWIVLQNFFFQLKQTIHFAVLYIITRKTFSLATLLLERNINLIIVMHWSLIKTRHWGYQLAWPDQSLHSRSSWVQVPWACPAFQRFWRRHSHRLVCLCFSSLPLPPIPSF